MDETPVEPIAGLRAALQRILTTPTAADLWQLQADLLAVGGEAAGKARQVAGQFYSYLRDLESKVASRRASRVAAALATASVTSVSLQEAVVEREKPLERILGSAVAAMLEIGSATQSVRAWGVEGALVHYDAAWYLYGELWDVSQAMQPGLAPMERRAALERLMAPLIAPQTDDAVKSVLLVRLFQAALAARMMPLLTAPPE